MLCQRCRMDNDQQSINCAYCGASVAPPVQASTEPQPVYHQVYATSIQGVVYQPPVILPPVKEPPIAQQPAQEEPLDYPSPAADFSQKKKKKRLTRPREGFGDAVLRLSGVGFKSLSREDKRKTVLQLIGLMLAVIAGSAMIQDLLL